MVTIVTYNELYILVQQAMNQKSDLMVQLTDGTIETFSADALSADYWHFLDNHFVEECGRMFYKHEHYGADFMTYNSLSEAMDHVGKMGCFGKRITKVYAVTCVNSEWWRGHYTGYLCEVLGEGLIYSID